MYTLNYMATNNEPNKSIRDSVLSAIEAGKVTMRPRWHFVLKATLIVIGIVLSIFASVYVVSFAIFSMHRSGAWFVPAFGSAGVREFIASLPWVLILLAVLFVIVLEVLVRQYSFAYRRPLFYSAFGVVVIATLGSVAFSQGGFHEEMFRRAQRGELPLGGQFYRKAGMHRMGHVTTGSILTLGEGGFTIVDTGGETVTVKITPVTRLPYGMDFSAGDIVVIFGNRDDGTIEADGVREIEESYDFPTMHPPYSPPMH